MNQRTPALPPLQKAGNTQHRNGTTVLYIYITTPQRLLRTPHLPSYLLKCVWCKKAANKNSKTKSLSLTASIELGHTPPKKPSSLAMNWRSILNGFPAIAPEPRGMRAMRGSMLSNRSTSRCHAAAWLRSQWDQRMGWAGCRWVKPRGGLF